MALKYEEKYKCSDKAEFIKKVTETANFLGVDPNDLMCIMNSESGLRPDFVSNDGATGLIQFTSSTAKAYGTTTEALCKMTGSLLMEYVKKYFTNGKGKFTHGIYDLFMYTFVPACVGWSEDRVIAYGDLTAEMFAESNPDIDLNKDGQISVAEFYDWVDKRIGTDNTASYTNTTTDPNSVVINNSTNTDVTKTSESSPMNVWSSSSSNAYSSVDTSGNNVTEKTEHTRIYQYFAPTIQLDEMSMPLDDKTATELSSSTADVSINFSDASLGNMSVEDYLEKLKSVKSTDSSANNNVNSKNYTTIGTNMADRTYAIGKAYPLIRINDRYFGFESVEKFVLDSTAFVPTIQLILNTSDSEMLKQNLIKDGDTCSVFINQGHGMLKSYRGDFLITYSYVMGKKSSNLNGKTRLYIEGELYVPELYDATKTFCVTGSSKSALIEAAKNLGLGFNFCDEQDTNDVQMWYCTSDGDQSDNIGDAPPLKFLKNTAKHAYSNFEDFYDCWIDIRYGLSFINVAKMLGKSGLDEPIDLAFFTSAMSNLSGANGDSGNASDEATKTNPKLQPKLITNAFTDEKAVTAFAIEEIEEINNSGSVTKSLGLTYKTNTNVTNPGLGSGGYDLQMNISIPVNTDKLANGFYLLAGPGTNSTYKKGENGSYVTQHITMQGGAVAATQSDTDAETLTEQDSNMECSGATNKYYEVAEKHNKMNNTWLQKKMVKVKLNGCNLQLMRGEKIPALVVDSPAGVNLAGVNEDNVVMKRTIENFTGWFIIKELKWIFDKSKNQKSGTLWTTEATLTRREWPVIGYNKAIMNGEITIMNTVNESTILEAQNELSAALNSSDGSSSETADTSTASNNGETVTTGLQPYMVTIYNDIKSAVSAKNEKMLLTSGKRWSVDSQGNKSDNAATVTLNNLYKFVNALGQECWFSSATSPHLTGDAIDIVNGQGTSFNDIIKIIANDKKTLADMLSNTVYCAIETGKDDMGQSVKHYHIGKKVETDLTSCSQYSAWWTVVKDLLQTETFESDGKTYNITTTTEEALKLTSPAAESIVSYSSGSSTVSPTDTSESTGESVGNLSATDLGLSEEGFQMICRFETGKNFGYTIQSKELTGYDLGDANGHKTYGYGLLYHPSTNNYMDKKQSTYTLSELETLYKQTAKNHAQKIIEFANKNNLSLTTNQIDAMTSAAYNFGDSKFLSKSVVKLIKKNPNDPLIKEVWAHMSDSLAAKYPGLVTRRKSEADWYFGIKS